MRLLSLIITLMARKSRWIRDPLPVDEGTFSHDPYCKFVLDCRDGFFGVRVIDLIAVLLMCNPYDVVCIDNDMTGISRVELFDGIPLMDMTNGVVIVSDRRDTDIVKPAHDSHSKKA